MANVTIDDYTIRVEDSAEQSIRNENIGVKVRPKPSGSQTEDFSPWLAGRDKTVGEQPPETANKLTDQPAWVSCPRRPRTARTVKAIVEEMKRNSKKGKVSQSDATPSRRPSGPLC
jgi:hypothetical protein